MSRRNKIITGMFLLMVGSMLSFNCNTAKKSQVQQFQLLLELEKGLTEKYIVSTYPEIETKSISPSNRTLNQYRASFAGTASQLKELTKKMETDKQVLTATIIENENNPKVKPSTNSKHSKVKPIKSNN